MVTVSTADHGGATSISSVHPDILQTHILTRLDGPTLAATSCASPELHTLSTDDKLWQKICSSMWPSIDNPSVRHVISAFPSGHRSFFSQSYPLIHNNSTINLSRPSTSSSSTTTTTTELISAVDIFYQDSLIISKVVHTETESGWFNCSPFRVDLLEPKEYIKTGVLQSGRKTKGLWLKELEENMKLSWILIDSNQKKAVNMSSLRAVSVDQHWLTGEIQARFAAVVAGGGGRGTEREYVKCEVVVTCGGEEGEQLHVREMSLGVEDMEGKSLSGKDSLAIIQGVMGGGGKRGRNNGETGKERFMEFLERKRERKERLERKERVLDTACIVVGVSIFVSFWCFFMFR